MKYSVIILFAFVIFSCNEEIDMLPPEVRVSSPFWISCGDTISLPIETKMEFSAYSDNKNLIYDWDFGDGNSSTEKSSYHSYSSKGIYPVSIKVSNGDKEGECVFYAKVFGQVVGNKSEYREGLWIFEHNNDNYIFTEGRSGWGLYMHKINDQMEIFVKQPSYYNNTYVEIVDFKMDYDNNFILLEDDGIAKIDLNATTLIKRGFSFFYKGHILVTSNNDYFLVGRNSYIVEYENLDNSGDRIIREQLYDNENSSQKCLDAMFINDKDYLMLFNNDEYYDYPYDTANISLVKRNIENENEIKLAIPNVYCENILNAGSGYIVYGFDVEWSCGGCYSYLNIVKISSDFDFEWHQRINLGDSYYDLNTFNEKILLREYDDRYVFFHDKDLFILTKTGEIIKQFSILENINFQINSVCASGQNTLILATIKNRDFGDTYEDETFPMIFKINIEGQIVD